MGIDSSYFQTLFYCIYKTFKNSKLFYFIEYSKNNNKKGEEIKLLEYMFIYKKKHALTLKLSSVKAIKLASYTYHINFILFPLHIHIYIL